MSRLATRLKLTDKQINEIMHIFAYEDYSRLQLARKYETSVYVIDTLLNFYEKRGELRYG